MGKLITILTPIMPLLVLATLLLCVAVLVLAFVFARKARGISEAITEQIRQAGHTPNKTRPQEGRATPSPAIHPGPPPKKRKPVDWEY